MKTVTINLFSFEELNEQAKDKALNELRDINLGHKWWEFIYEDAKNIGLKITSFDTERNRHAKGEFLLAANEVAQNILNNHGESCETYKTAKFFMDIWQPLFADYMTEGNDNYESGIAEQRLMEMEEDFLTALLEDYSIMLEREMEYLYSNEAVIETIEANEYIFTEDGKPY